MRPTVDATPSKRLFYSIIQDYPVDRAICELVDNVLDQWTLGQRRAPVTIDIDIDVDRKTITISDTAGGVAPAHVGLLVGPGNTGNQPSDQTIGIFGVGTKRAVVALATDVSISTHKTGHEGCKVRFDDEWLHDQDNWTLPLVPAPTVAMGTTVIELSRLRPLVDGAVVSALKAHLQHTYALFLTDDKLALRLNKERLSPLGFSEWAYPPGFEPRRFRGSLPGTSIHIEAVAGLATESSPAGEYGLTLYCNGRQVARNVRTPEVGYESGVAGVPHPGISLVHLEIRLTGAAGEMPWNSSKSDISYTHGTFQAMRKWIQTQIADFSKLSRGWSNGEWDSKVFQYTEGQMVLVDVDFEKPRQSYLPKLPKFRPRRHENLIQRNKDRFRERPYLRGTLEGLIAVDLARKFPLESANRIALIILDSTFEIAMKDFLAYESGEQYSDERLLVICKQRHAVEKEVRKHRPGIADGLWRKLRVYYDVRCKFVHEKAMGQVGATQLDDFRAAVADVLEILFGKDWADFNEAPVE